MKLGQGSSSHHQRPVLGAAQKAQEPGRRPTASLFNNASKLTMVAVVLGLLSSLPSGAFSVPRQADAEAPPSAIPIKLSPASFPSRKRQRRIPRRCQARRKPCPPCPSPNLGWRDSTLKTLPPPPSTKSSATPKPKTPSTTPPNFHAWSQVSPADPTTNINLLPQTLLTYGAWGVDAEGKAREGTKGVEAW